MAKAREVKRRIKSVENTKQITRTMEMVATSKLKRATDRVYAARPYSQALDAIVKSLYLPELSERYPLLRQPEKVDRVGILLLTANRGLCGAFNANLIRETRDLVARLEKAGKTWSLHVAGKKGIAYFRFRDVEMASARTDVGDAPTVEEAESLVAPLRAAFLNRRVDQVLLVSSEFRSALSTPPVVTEILPIRPEDEAVAPANFLLSPSGDRILSRLLPLYVRNKVYRALVENAAAEQGARRTAMKNATDNAEEMLTNLTRQYNRARQAQITQEIAEIVGGAAALE